MKYSFDTNIFININKKYPREEDNDDVWELIESKLENGEILVSEEVIEELKEGTDDLAKWLTDNFPDAIVETDDEIQRIAAEIAMEYEGWINPEETKNRADPYVIAVAMKYNCTVVSEEKINRFLKDYPEQWENQPHSVSIPFICKRKGIPHSDFVKYLIKTGDFT